jgi:CheY-like chemotaxis protein
MSAIEELKGLRVLVVEDEMMICLLFEDMLLDFGCEIIGPACDIGRALELAQRHESIDVAILDVNISGQGVFPVADILSRRGIPFLFATGMGAAGLPRDWQGYPILQKPMTMAQLADTLGSTIRQCQS